MTEQDSVPPWDPSAYILRGQHCPKAAIKKTLTATMQALGASQLLHIAFADDQGIVGSLSFVIGYPSKLAHKLNELMARAPTGGLVDSLNMAVRGQESEAILGPEIAHMLANNIARMNVQEYSLPEADVQTFFDHVKSGIYLTHTGSFDVTPISGEIRSIILLDVIPMATGLLHEAGLAHQLAVQLKSTAEASALSDVGVMKRVAERLRPADQGVSARIFPDIASKALDLALDVTNSDAGALYFISTKARHPFERMVSSSSAHFPELIARDKGQDLTTVVSQNLAVQRTGWLVRANGPQHPESSDGVFLLAPIGGPGVDPVRPAIGVMVLHRHDRMHMFSAYDLALIRNVTLRISLARTTDVMSRIGGVTSALRGSTDWSAILDAMNHEETDLQQLWIVVPTDVRLAARRIAPALAELAALTDSHSVSLRLALPSAKVNESHGLALVRVACYPESLWTDNLPVQTEDLEDFNWICFQENDVVLSPDVSTRPRTHQLRSDTVSQLAAPVRQEGRLVGVLNLQSPLYDAYDLVLPLITSFAGAVGRTLADARASLEDRVIDSAAQALNHRHTMQSHLDHLVEKINKLNLSRQRRKPLNAELRKIQDELDAMRQVSSPRIGQSATVPQILEAAANDVGYLGDLPPDMWSQEFAPSVTGARARPLRVAIANILSNLINYTASSAEDAPAGSLRTVSLSKVYLEGTNQIVIGFQNYAGEYVSSIRIADLYRCPIPDHEGRLRVGGFLAGLNAQRANARVQSTLLNDGRSVRTTLIVPIEG
jgi:GAF domain-containing protein